MTNQHANPWMAAPDLTSAEYLRGEFEAALRTACEVWAKQAHWQRVPRSAAENVPTAAAGDEPSQEALQTFAPAQTVKYYPQADGSELFVSAVNGSARAPLAVIGRLRGPELAVRRQLLEATRDAACLRLELAAVHCKFRDYINQVTTDFEELAWLRGLSEQPEVRNQRQDFRSVAAAVLPSLAELIQAECVVLIDETADFAGTREGEFPRGGEDFVTGSAPLAAADYRRLLTDLSAVASQGPVVRNAARRSAFLPGYRKIRNCLLCKIARNDQHYGWLLAINKEIRVHENDELLTANGLSSWEFSTFEAGLVSAAATMLAAHARNIQQFREKEALLVGVTRALVNAIDAKDAYTCGHSDRVALIARILARQISCDPRECDQIYMSGLLHDLGKIGVPDEILTKAGALTDDEFALIKKHPEIGYEILKHLKQLDYVLPGVRHHHESFNGEGYPHRLHGTEIPLQARIMAVADAYDAMTSCRPYRSAMPLDKAESILRAGSGTQWDPRIIEAFFAAKEEIQRVCLRDRNHKDLLVHGDELAFPAGALPPDWDTISLAVNALACST